MNLVTLEPICEYPSKQSVLVDIGLTSETTYGDIARAIAISLNSIKIEKSEFVDLDIYLIDPVPKRTKYGDVIAGIIPVRFFSLPVRPEGFITMEKVWI